MNLKTHKQNRIPLKIITNTVQIKRNSISSQLQKKSLKVSKAQTLTKSFITCKNHPEVISKFMINSADQTLYYCEDCSRLIQSQGLHMLQIGNEQNLNTILIKLQQALSNILKLKQTNSQKERSIQTHYEKMGNKLTIYKQSITAKIQSLFNAQSKSLEQSFSKQIYSVKADRNSLQSQQSQIRHLITDIKMNRRGRDSVTFMKFGQAMQSYKITLENLQNKSNQVKAKLINTSGFMERSFKKCIEQSLVINEGRNMVFSVGESSSNLAAFLETGKQVRLSQSINVDHQMEQQIQQQIQQSFVQYRSSKGLDRLI